MKINVYADNKKIRLWIPNFLITSRLATYFISKSIDDVQSRNKIKESLPKCYKIIKEYRRENGPLKLVEVKTSSGEIVEITI